MGVTVGAHVKALAPRQPDGEDVSLLGKQMQVAIHRRAADPLVSYMHREVHVLRGGVRMGGADGIEHKLPLTCVASLDYGCLLSAAMVILVIPKQAVVTNKKLS